MEKKIRVTVWNEFVHEREEDYIGKIYPEGIHGAIKNFLSTEDDFEVTAVSLDMPEQGLPDELLNNTDVLIWWGHVRHWMVEDSLVERIAERVYKYGMGFIALHSAHHSKVFKRILGCTGDLVWGENQKEIIWNLNPTHPIAAGIPDHFVLDDEELYCEPFYIPTPDELVFCGWYEYGGLFRGGACYRRGLGKVFYFQPGHEECRSFYNPYVQKIIKNAVRWAEPNDFGVTVPESCPELTVRYHEPKK